MKSALLALIIGSVLLYFVDNALKINNFELEMFIHNIIRFGLGFVFLGILVWYKRQLKFKVALICIVTLSLLDVMFDYIRDVGDFSFEMMIHGVFLVIWGSVTGFLFMRKANKNLSNPSFNS
jgi:hypothetical protein